MIFASQIRQKLVETLNKGKLDKEENAVISAILLGSDDKLDADLAKRYASAGVSHILCVSGMHVGIIFIIINYVLFFLSKNKKQKIIKTVILLFSVWLYACITGMSPSVMRASTMFTFVAFGNMFERNVNTYNSLLSSFFFLSCINPLIVFEVGINVLSPYDELSGAYLLNSAAISLCNVTVESVGSESPYNILKRLGIVDRLIRFYNYRGK